MLPVSTVVNLKNNSDLVVLIKCFIFTYQKLMFLTTKDAQVVGALAIFLLVHE